MYKLLVVVVVLVVYLCLMYEKGHTKRLSYVEVSLDALNCPKEDRFDRERIVFVHIPKTGGTSMRSWLQHHFKMEDRSWHYSIEDKLKRWTIDEHNVGKFASGHAPANSMLQGARANASVVTVLRNPTSRIMSLFVHLLWQKRLEKYNITTFDQFVANYKQWDPDWNIRVRSFYGSSLEEAIRFFKDRVSLIGIYERLHETIWLARELFPWLSELPFPYVNKGDYEFPDIAPDTMTLMASLLNEEYQLYVAAENIFNQRLLCRLNKGH